LSLLEESLSSICGLLLPVQFVEDFFIGAQRLPVLIGEDRVRDLREEAQSDEVSTG